VREYATTSALTIRTVGRYHKEKPKAATTLEVSEEFMDMALDLKSLFGTTKPRRATLARLIDTYQNRPDTLHEEVQGMFEEFTNGRGGKHIDWSKN
jgi:hypothetical protein